MRLHDSSRVFRTLPQVKPSTKGLELFSTTVRAVQLVAASPKTWFHCPSNFFSGQFEPSQYELHLETDRSPADALKAPPCQSLSCPTPPFCFITVSFLYRS